MYPDSDRYPIYAYCVPDIKTQRDRVVTATTRLGHSRKGRGLMGGMGISIVLPPTEPLIQFYSKHMRRMVRQIWLK